LDEFEISLPLGVLTPARSSMLVMSGHLTATKSNLTSVDGASSPTLSFVLPIHNEQDNLEVLYQRLSLVMDELDETCEAIMVDDGSRDGSYKILREIRLRDPRFKLVHFSRNFGHQAAITAGLDLALGDAVVVMDGDLQHPPEVVPAMVASWREGFEVVNAVCHDRHGDTRFKRASARVFYWLMQRLTRVEMTANAGDFRLVDRGALEALKAMRENARYLRGMFSWVGFRQTTIPYEYHERLNGRPKYDLARMMRLGVDGIVSFSDIPLQAALHLGFLVAGLSFLAGVSDIATKLVGGNTVPGWLSLAITVSFLGGMQLVILGVMGIYMGRMYDEVKNRPLYIVRELAGIDIHENTQARSLVVNARSVE
jgi:glycosyltransferase involved in cell wall biosynthesis